MKKIIVIATAWLTLSCKTEIKKKEIDDKPGKQVENVDLSGSYVSDGYVDRNDGGDWVAVMVSQIDQDELKLSVRSRADKKKPTCSFDAILQKVDGHTYKTLIHNTVVLFQFAKDQITIGAKNKNDQNVLYFYCSGGATLAGTYSKVQGPIDQQQIDKTQFTKVLELQDIGFNVSAIKKNGINQLTVFTFGLPREYNETVPIYNQEVINAEAEDLNSDGSPELVVFTRENSPNKKGHVYAFSVNDHKSMSAVSFPPTDENDRINSGYRGMDEFALGETDLIQRFPIFENNVKTGKYRQVRYKLEDGEALRTFVVEEVNDHQ